MEDTIAAIATALSNSGISIIRISGENAIEIASKVYSSPSGNREILKTCDSHTIHYGFICNNDEIIDEVMVLVMRAPNTYTKEDCVEIDCHGGVVVTKRVLEAVLKQGARIAEPGEFTKRAFLNGRIDLSKAEAVLDLIHAKNDFAAKNSIKQLSGQIFEQVDELRKKMIQDIAFIEAALDDPEHFEWDEFHDTFGEHLDYYNKSLEYLLQRSQDGKLLTEGIRTAIVGKPNAGKSSILNLLVGSEKAIVTDIAGTTRDIIEETILLDGIVLRVMDTAGVRDTNDIVESIGVERTLQVMNEADLVLYVVDRSIALDESDETILSHIHPERTILIKNKSDLMDVLSTEDVKRLSHLKAIDFSAKDGEGISQLKEQITDLFFHGHLQMEDEVYLTNMRQKEMIENARRSIEKVRNSVQSGMPEDFYSIDLMDAYDSLGLLIGQKTSDDLIDTIFRDFCMGK